MLPYKQQRLNGRQHLGLGDTQSLSGLRSQHKRASHMVTHRRPSSSKAANRRTALQAGFTRANSMAALPHPLQRHAGLAVYPQSIPLPPSLPLKI